MGVVERDVEARRGERKAADGGGKAIKKWARKGRGENDEQGEVSEVK